MTPEIENRIEQIRCGEVPEGYKKTKVGIVPTEWEETHFRVMFSRLNRKNTEGSTNVLTISAQHGLISQADFFNKAIASEDKSNYFLLYKGEYAYNKSYSNGYPFGALKPLEMYECGIVSPLYICFSQTTRNKCPQYYSQYFEGGLMNREIKAFAQEGARNHGLMNISVDDFFNSYLIVPPLEEQQKIVDILTAQDKVIDLQQKKIEELQKLKRVCLQKMFPPKSEIVPEVRFPGFSDAWEQRKLGEVTQRVQGNDGRMDLPTLTISAGNGWLDQRDRFSANIAGKEQQNYTLLHKGELSYNHGNSKLAKYGAVFSLQTHEEALVPRVYHSFKVTENASADFVEYLFATKLPDQELGKLISSGARMDGLLNINYDEFMGINIAMPSVVEQKQISTYFRNLDNLITLHQRKLDEMKNYKKALMQLLLTGIVRVKV